MLLHISGISLYLRVEACLCVQKHNENGVCVCVWGGYSAAFVCIVRTPCFAGSFRSQVEGILITVGETQIFAAQSADMHANEFAKVNMTRL